MCGSVTLLSIDDGVTFSIKNKGIF
jgi:hypothetical protein